MNIEEHFGKFLKAEHLQGRVVTVTIENVTMEEVYKDKRPQPVMYFRGKDRGMVMNVTNKNTIVAVHGPETTRWAGQQIVLFVDHNVQYEGKTVDGIRVRIPSPGQAAQAPLQTPAQQPAAPISADQTGDPTMDDEIPW